jgi:hypothetical protein
MLSASRTSAPAERRVTGRTTSRAQAQLPGVQARLDAKLVRGGVVYAAPLIAAYEKLAGAAGRARIDAPEQMAFAARGVLEVVDRKWPNGDVTGFTSETKEWISVLRAWAVGQPDPRRWSAEKAGSLGELARVWLGESIPGDGFALSANDLEEVLGRMRGEAPRFDVRRTDVDTAAEEALADALLELAPQSLQSFSPEALAYAKKLVRRCVAAADAYPLLDFERSFS